jgi:hypothetical protein
MLAQVVEDAHKAVIWILPILDKMPRTRRFGLGQRIENHLLQLIVLLSQAGYSHKKQPILQAANLELVAVRHLWRLCFELQLVAMPKYEYFSQMLHKIGQQIGGWLKRVD